MISQRSRDHNTAVQPHKRAVFDEKEGAPLFEADGMRACMCSIAGSDWHSKSLVCCITGHLKGSLFFVLIAPLVRRLHTMTLHNTVRAQVSVDLFTGTYRTSQPR